MSIRTISAPSHGLCAVRASGLQRGMHPCEDTISLFEDMKKAAADVQQPLCRRLEGQVTAGVSG